LEVFQFLQNLQNHLARWGGIVSSTYSNLPGRPPFPQPELPVSGNNIGVMVFLLLTESYLGFWAQRADPSEGTFVESPLVSEKVIGNRFSYSYPEGGEEETPPPLKKVQPQDPAIQNGGLRGAYPIFTIYPRGNIAVDVDMSHTFYE